MLLVGELEVEPELELVLVLDVDDDAVQLVNVLLETVKLLLLTVVLPKKTRLSTL